MNTPQIFIYNAETGEETLRDMTPEEVEEIESFEHTPIE
jgi:hypothetical protein